MGFSPLSYDDKCDAGRLVAAIDKQSPVWTPILHHECPFDPAIFECVMLRLVRNPNLNSSWLFRADILYDDHDKPLIPPQTEPDDPNPVVPAFVGFRRHRTLIRTLVSRNPARDPSIDQTCAFYKSEKDESVDSRVRSLVVYIPHAVSSPEDLPFYHPKVRCIAYLHEWGPGPGSGTISLHYSLFHPGDAENNRLQRTALGLLGLVYRHGQGELAGYQKRVQHDVVIPQARFQDRFAKLKHSYAKDLVSNWAESTNPAKHVFEDLGIAAFLIELWIDMYAKNNKPFPGFVDIGCGNGLLVYILCQEGYSGWGFDARSRKSWQNYATQDYDDTTESDGPGPRPVILKQQLLLPAIAAELESSGQIPEQEAAESSSPLGPGVHPGTFPTGTFIISNHADELTPWTPILATLSECPFIAIPCCSHNLGGDKFRAPPPRDPSKPKSQYASLVDWVAHIAEDCGWNVETEMLRIPSTRNTALLGRTRTGDVNLGAVVTSHGGAAGYYTNIKKLLGAAAPRGH